VIFDIPLRYRNYLSLVQTVPPRYANPLKSAEYEAGNIPVAPKRLVQLDQELCRRDSRTDHVASGARSKLPPRRYPREAEQHELRPGMHRRRCQPP